MSYSNLKFCELSRIFFGGKIKYMSLEKYSGLNNVDIAKLQTKYGLNSIEIKNNQNLIWKILAYFKNPIILILLCASFLSGVLGQVQDALIIVIMVLVSILLDFVQEYRASSASAKLSQKLAKVTTVIRDGLKQTIDIKNLVPNDIIFLNIGSIVPADAEVLELDSFQTNESVLSGESFAIEKQVGSSVWAGTNVVAGWAYLRVTKIGLNSSFGKIAKSLKEPEIKNAFAVGVSSFGNLILKVAIIIVSIVTLIILSKAFLSGEQFTEAELLKVFLFAITIGVGLTPELLPVITSLNLARGSLAMNKQGVLVKKLYAIPDFGSMDVLCTDKTGTLTEDKISLIKHIDVAGQESEKVYTLGYYNSHFQSGLKNPLDLAILSHEKADLYSITKLDEIPYDFERKRLSVILQDSGKEPFICTKGQVEEILKICDKYEINGGQIDTLNDQVLANVTEIYHDLSRQGYRVLGVAYRSIEGAETQNIELEQKMILAGLLAFLDPPKLTAKKALDLMEKYGLKIKILTGDNELVTTKVCQEIDLPDLEAMTGTQIDLQSDAELSQSVERIGIFARVNPAQKQRIIKILQQNGHVVGYMGDGINDAPSLKAADVGISVDNAVDIAKESADMILLDKNLENLVLGVIEGRKTFGNTQKYMFMALSSNFGNMLSMIGAVLFLPFLPMLPTQILFNNLLYDISQVGIPMDWVDEEDLATPKKWDLDFIKKFMLVFGPLSTAFDLATFYIMYQILHLDQASFQTVWFMESLATQILVIFVIRTRKIPILESVPGKYLLISALSMLLVGFLVPFSPLNSYFNFVNLSFQVILTIVGLVATYLILAQCLKVWFYRRFQTSSN